MRETKQLISNQRNAELSIHPLCLYVVDTVATMVGHSNTK